MNGVSVLNSSYQEVVDLLRSTGVIVELTVSQLYQNFENKLKLESMRYINVEDSDSIQCARTSLHELTNIKQGMIDDQSKFLKSTKSLPNLLNVNE